MKAYKTTALAMSIAALTASMAANAADDKNQSADINHNHVVTEVRNNKTSNDTTTKNDTTTTTTTTTTNTTSNDTNNNYVSNYSATSNTVNNVENTTTNNEYRNVEDHERREKDNHAVDVSFKKDIRLSSDIQFSGSPTISGDIEIDSAAISIIDNRQSASDNMAINELVTNDAAIGDDVGSDASGNLGFNVAAGDNNVQDNAAALSATDASFSFGMADAEVFVNQSGSANLTLNSGVTNSAGLSGNAFSNASGNIAVNLASGNNNMQKNALAGSVATSAYATASVASNQVSSGNAVANYGHYERMVDTIDVTMSGTVDGSISGGGSYGGTGNAYQHQNFYPDIWPGAGQHPTNNPQWGHADLDNEAQGATQNPYNPGNGGLAFDTDEEGTFSEQSNADLTASLSGQIVDVSYVAVDATNTAGLSGSAFSGASGNIGVNVAAGTGNMQANSLSMAVAQPTAAPGGGGDTGGGNGGG